MIRFVHRRDAGSNGLWPGANGHWPDGGDAYEARMAATDQSPFAVARRQAEAATGVAMRGWTGRYDWIRAWHYDLTLIEAGRRGVLPATLQIQLGRALRNETVRREVARETERRHSAHSGARGVGEPGAARRAPSARGADPAALRRSAWADGVRRAGR